MCRADCCVVFIEEIVTGVGWWAGCCERLRPCCGSALNDLYTSNDSAQACVKIVIAKIAYVIEGPITILLVVLVKSLSAALHVEMECYLLRITVLFLSFAKS